MKDGDEGEEKECITAMVERDRSDPANICNKKRLYVFHWI